MTEQLQKPPLFSVLLPITRPPALLPLAIESVLEQSIADFELLVICDGAPAETVACAKAYAKSDFRVQVFEFPKGARHGEEYRDRVLNEAVGRYVAQICDDDLWFPNHLEEMKKLLTTADFGNLLHVQVRPQGTIDIFPGDLSRPEVRQRMIDERYNFFGLSFAGYRLDAYKKLPHRWSPAPFDIWTDLFMWRKFLARSDLVFATRAAVTAVHFAAPERDSWSLEERRDENRQFLERIRKVGSRAEIEEAAWRSLLARTIELRGVASGHKAARSQLEGQIKALRTTLEDSRDELRLLRRSQDELRLELVQTKRCVRDMLESTSWRLTATLRRLGELLRKN